jgi:hypothetical protein
MAAESGADVHHGAPRCLLALFDAAAGGLAAWSEFDAEVKRLSIEVRGTSREELTTLIKSSTFDIPTPSISGCIRKQATSCGRAGAGPEDPGPLRPAVLLAACLLEVVAR